jgi:hypothetical protein
MNSYFVVTSHAVVSRPLCPFYGFSWPESTSHLYDRGDDCCGLAFENRQTCFMEGEGLPIDHRGCPIYAQREVLVTVGTRYIVVHPKEFPAGISFRKWRQYLEQQPRTE